MSVWRPKDRIQVKALGLVWRNGELLAAQIANDDGSLKGVRPLGGCVEFGERWQDTIVREFREELDVAVQVTGRPLILENIYSHQGVLGHEVVFVAEIDFPDTAYAGGGPITFYEDNGTACRADWYDLAALDTGGLALYPTGLKAHLMARSTPV